MTKRERERRHRLLPDGKPKYIRLYDNGGATADRYTVVLSGRIPGKIPGRTFYLRMSENPYHPQGVGISGESFGPIDSPRYSHLGRKITFDQLPPRCQEMVLDRYCDFWELPNPQYEKECA